MTLLVHLSYKTNIVWKFCTIPSAEKGDKVSFFVVVFTSPCYVTCRVTCCRDMFFVYEEFRLGANLIDEAFNEKRKRYLTLSCVARCYFILRYNKLACFTLYYSMLRFPLLVYVMLRYVTIYCVLLKTQL